MPIKRLSYIAKLTSDTRRRYTHIRSRGEIINFVVQLEVFVKDKWLSIIRYDTAHGYAHKHLFRYSGEHEQIPLFTHNYTEALDFADNDIKINWELYRERFLKEAQND